MDHIQDALAAIMEFVHQDEHTLMIVRSADEELAPVAHCLTEIDGATDHVVVVDATPVGNDLTAYVEAVLTNLFAEAQKVQEDAAEEEEEPFPPFPPQCYQRNVEPMVRLRMAYAHLVTQWFPEGDESNLVVALLPSAIHNAQLQAHIVGWLMPQAHFEPWMARTKFIVRDDKAKPFVVDTARNARAHGVVYFDTRLTATDQVETLMDDATNPDLEPGRRMNALLHCAVAEVSLGRYAQAIQKFTPLYAHYAAHGIYQLQVVILMQVAECFRRVNSLVIARQCLNGALDLATANSDLGLMASSAHGLAVLAASQGALPQMEQACDIGIGAAGAMDMHDLHADFLLRLGDARAQFNNWAGALVCWTEGAKVARAHEGTEMLLQVLDRLHNYASRAGHGDHARAYAAEMQQVRAAGGAR